MAKTVHCWRCRTEIPMLDESEWERMHPRLTGRIEGVKAYRQAHGVGIAEARKHLDGEALDLYREMTGYVETNAEAIWHHRMAIYGPPCKSCGHLLRTPRASFCASCGTPAPEG